MGGLRAQRSELRAQSFGARKTGSKAVIGPATPVVSAPVVLVDSRDRQRLRGFDLLKRRSIHELKFDEQTSSTMARMAKVHVFCDKRCKAGVAA